MCEISECVDSRAIWALRLRFVVFLMGRLAKSFRESPTAPLAFAASFEESEVLRKVSWHVIVVASVFLEFGPKAGMSFLLDHSGRLLTKSKCSLNDVAANEEAKVLGVLTKLASVCCSLSLPPFLTPEGYSCSFPWHWENQSTGQPLQTEQLHTQPGSSGFL